MLLTISTTLAPATDLGYLLHKRPDRAQSFPVATGTAHVFYPEAGADRCTAALLLEVDPVALIRGRRGTATEAFTLGQYVNDRPYAASSLLAVALSTVFRTALRGRCEARPQLAAAPIPLQLHLPALPCRGGTEIAARLFGPLGWQVHAEPVPADPRFPEWGDSRYLDLTLTGSLRLADALNHLYVLLPVLDDAKHYWVGPDEVDKLVRAGAGWLATHPERELITRRYLAHLGRLTRDALERLADLDDTPGGLDALDVQDGELGDDVVQEHAGHEHTGHEHTGQPEPLAVQRRGAVLAVLRAAGARTVADLGCGSGVLTADLLADHTFSRVLAADVSSSALGAAARRLRLDRDPDRYGDRLRLLQSSLTYRDERLAGLDAAVLMEVVEHVDPDRLPALEQVVFGAARPGTVVVTTPNVEHNVRYASLPPGQLRHRDHRFEWTRAQFATWARAVADRRGYTVRHLPVGADDPEVGSPTQMAVFSRSEAS